MRLQVPTNEQGGIMEGKRRYDNGIWNECRSTAAVFVEVLHKWPVYPLKKKKLRTAYRHTCAKTTAVAITNLVTVRDDLTAKDYSQGIFMR